MQKDNGSEVKIDGSVPKYPIFNGITDPIVRALLAMIVGCDACPGGAKGGSGPKVAMDLLSKYSRDSGRSLHNSLATKIAKLKNAPIKDKDAILCFCESMIYEKTGNGDCDYLFGNPPTILDNFNREFAATTTSFIDGPKVVTYKGCYGTAHKFLKAEPHSQCVICLP